MSTTTTSPAEPDDGKNKEQETGLTPWQRESMESRKLIPVRSDGIHPQSMNDMVILAQTLHRSKLAPQGLNASWEQVFVAIGHAMELGLPILSGIQNIAVINGRATLWGDAALALCQDSEQFDHTAFEEQVSGTSATCTVRRNIDGAKPVVRTFTLDDAKRARLYPAKDRDGNDSPKSPWNTYTARMLQMRARMWALRDCFPGLLKGIKATEEAWDEPQQASVVIDATPQRLPGETKSDHLANVLEKRKEQYVRPVMTQGDVISHESLIAESDKRIDEILPEQTQQAVQESPKPAEMTVKPSEPTKAAEAKPAASEAKSAEKPKPRKAANGTGGAAAKPGPQTPAEPAKPSPKPASEPPKPAETPKQPRQFSGPTWEIFSGQAGNMEAGDEKRLADLMSQVDWALEKGHIDQEMRDAIKSIGEKKVKGTSQKTLV